MKDDLFLSQLEQKAHTVDAALAALLPEASIYPDIIHQAMRYAALGGGKRVRGVLTLVAAKLGDIPTDNATSSAPEATTFGEVSAAQAPDGFLHEMGPTDDRGDVTPHIVRQVGVAASAAAAIEMLHAYTLVHDDLPAMDDDDWRRGQPTTHRVYGEGIAVLTGDALLTRSFEVLSALPCAGLSPAAAMDVIARLARATGAARLIGGQAVDLEAEDRDENLSTDRLKTQLEYIHLNKTAALIRASLLIGADIGGLGEAERRALDVYGRAVGLLFQIGDDLLDMLGDEATLGKEVGADVRRGKLTYPALYGVERSKEAMRRQAETAKGSLVVFGGKARFLIAFVDHLMERSH